MNTDNSSNHAWDVQIEDAVLRLTRSRIKDFDYWFATVDIVDAGYDPETRKPITLDQLDAWVNRCEAKPEELPDDTPSPPTRCVTPHRLVPNGTQRNHK